MFDESIIQIVINKHTWNAGIEYLETMNVDVVKYFIKCAIVSIKDESLTINDIVIWCKTHAPSYQKYADEVEKYLMLV